MTGDGTNFEACIPPAMHTHCYTHPGYIYLCYRCFLIALSPDLSISCSDMKNICIQYYTVMYANLLLIVELL